MDIFDTFMEQLAHFTKAQLIKYGQMKGIWSSHPNMTEYLKRQTKKSLRCIIADRLVRRELRGY